MKSLTAVTKPQLLTKGQRLRLGHEFQGLWDGWDVVGVTRLTVTVLTTQTGQVEVVPRAQVERYLREGWLRRWTTPRVF